MQRAYIRTESWKVVICHDSNLSDTYCTELKPTICPSAYISSHPCTRVIFDFMALKKETSESDAEMHSCCTKSNYMVLFNCATEWMVKYIRENIFILHLPRFLSSFLPLHSFGIVNVSLPGKVARLRPLWSLNLPAV